MPTGLHKRVIGKSGNYSPSLATDRATTIFSTRDAAGASVFTLPTPTRAYLGCEWDFVQVNDQNLTVQGTTAGDIQTLNNNAAASVAASTAGQKRGARIRAICIETVSGTFKWFVTGVTVGATFTVA